MKALGSLASVVVCAGCSTISAVEPYYGEPFFASTQRLEEYEALRDEDRAAALRAWIREADRIIRANNALRGEL